MPIIIGKKVYNEKVGNNTEVKEFFDALYSLPHPVIEPQSSNLRVKDVAISPQKIGIINSANNSSIRYFGTMYLNRCVAFYFYNGSGDRLFIHFDEQLIIHDWKKAFKNFSDKKISLMVLGGDIGADISKSTIINIINSLIDYTENSEEKINITIEKQMVLEHNLMNQDPRRIKETFTIYLQNRMMVLSQKLHGKIVDLNLDGKVELDFQNPEKNFEQACPSLLRQFIEAYGLFAKITDEDLLIDADLAQIKTMKGPSYDAFMQAFARVLCSKEGYEVLLKQFPDILEKNRPYLTEFIINLKTHAITRVWTFNHQHFKDLMLRFRLAFFDWGKIYTIPIIACKEFNSWRPEISEPAKGLYQKYGQLTIDPNKFDEILKAFCITTTYHTKAENQCYALQIWEACQYYVSSLMAPSENNSNNQKNVKQKMGGWWANPQPVTKTPAKDEKQKIAIQPPSNEEWEPPVEFDQCGSS